MEGEAEQRFLYLLYAIDLQLRNFSYTCQLLTKGPIGSSSQKVRQQ